MNAKRPLLIVEYSDGEYDVAIWTLRQPEFARPVVRCPIGDEAFDLLFRRGRYGSATTPALIVLDLNLSVTDGRDVLAQVKDDAGLRAVPVIVFTTSSNPRNVERCYATGANTYLVKPVDFARFRQLWRQVGDYWFDAALLPSGLE